MVAQACNLCLGEMEIRGSKKNPQKQKPKVIICQDSPTPSSPGDRRQGVFWNSLVCVGVGVGVGGERGSLNYTGHDLACLNLSPNVLKSYFKGFQMVFLITFLRFYDTKINHTINKRVNIIPHVPSGVHFLLSQRHSQISNLGNVFSLWPITSKFMGIWCYSNSNTE